VIPFLEQGFYFVPYSGRALPDTAIRVFLKDGTFLEKRIPLALPLADVQAIADNTRDKPLSELKAAQAAFEEKLIADRGARREKALAEDRKTEDARANGMICPKCGFSYGWDGAKCDHCKYPEA